MLSAAGAASFFLATVFVRLSLKPINLSSVYEDDMLLSLVLPTVARFQPDFSGQCSTKKHGQLTASRF
jgi:hypothetical protein